MTKFKFILNARPESTNKKRLTKTRGKGHQEAKYEKVGGVLYKSSIAQRFGSHLYAFKKVVGS